jgi:broad specificity phosphatase PhoE
MADFDSTLPKRVIYLVRHGNFNRKAEPADGLGGALTALGRQQARRLANRLRHLPISAIYHSDLRRAAETAALIAEKLPGVPVKSSRLLRECIPMVPAVVKDLPPDFAAAFTHLTPEDIAEAEQQVEQAYARFFKLPRQTRHEVIVCHGNIIRYFICRVMGAPIEAWGGLDIRHTGLSEIILEPGWNRVASVSDIGHLPPKMWTYV